MDLPKLALHVEWELTSFLTEQVDGYLSETLLFQTTTTATTERLTISTAMKRQPAIKCRTQPEICDYRELPPLHVAK